MKNHKLIIFTFLLIIGGCKKSEFLDKKPSTSLLVPRTLADFQAILDNADVMNYAGGLDQMGADDYIVDNANYLSLSIATQRNSYIWAKDIYNGETSIPDWNIPYKQVFYANAVLDGLAESNEATTSQGKYLKGWALFNRAFAFYNLAKVFCSSYDANSSATDLGIPLRLTASIDYKVQRSTLQQTFDQIINDLLIAETLLPSSRPSANLNRPSTIAVYALLARIYLDMRNYTQAESYAGKCLSQYNLLIDYITISRTSASPFSQNNDELIYNCTGYNWFAITGTLAFVKSRVSPELLSLYSPNDLRFVIYFNKLKDNTYTMKRGYYGPNGSEPFNGLATDEVFLIKSECLARRNEVTSAMDILNQLLIKRWDPSATVPAKPFENISAADQQDALAKIITERRKELVWRALRWHDLKRLNKEGANIKLSRTVNGQVYTLPPNDKRYVFPIPDDEITLSGIQQNIR